METDLFFSPNSKSLQISDSSYWRIADLRFWSAAICYSRPTSSNFTIPWSRNGWSPEGSRVRTIGEFLFIISRSRVIQRIIRKISL